jgi:hypothetical protein
LYYQKIWRHHGTPRKYISDCGPQFIAEFTCELWHLIGIEPATSTVYHPQTDRQTEHVNQELEQFFCMFTSYKQDTGMSSCWQPSLTATTTTTPRRSRCGL